jgi:hypothetical protein
MVPIKACSNEANIVQHCQARFPLSDFFGANKEKANVIGWVSVCRHPIKLLFSLFAKANSPNGKRALGQQCYGQQCCTMLDENFKQV